MRCSFLILLLSVPFSVINAQIEAVPLSVQKALSQRHPSATAIEWELEDENIFEANFEMNEKEMSANFDDEGSWLETETSIAESDLPAKVRSAILYKYAGFKIEGVELVEVPEKDFFYEIDISKQDMNMEVCFAKDGDFIDEKREGEDDPDNN